MTDMHLNGREKLSRYVDKSLDIIVEISALRQSQVSERYVRGSLVIFFRQVIAF